MSVTTRARLALRDRAAAVLCANDAGTWTKASPHLYPHQWSWDSAFNAIGWAHLDAGRALTELEVLFAAQWATGMVPHIVFRAGPDEPYFPGPDWRDRGLAGLARRFDAVSGLCSDYDVRTGEPISLRTFAAFAPLFAGTPDPDQRAVQLRRLDAGDFCGCPRLRWHLLPSTSPAEPAFEPRNYWRGPVWPVIGWLLWRGLGQLGHGIRAAQIRRDSLDQVAAAGEFAEYFEPFTGEPLGSPQQSWTAAVTLDWLAEDPRA